jgi:uncharacterized membrane protein
VITFGVGMIALHNLLDSLSSGSWLWTILHQYGQIEFAPYHAVLVSYQLIPWVGVMAAGYGFGQLWLLEPERRRRTLLCVGLGLTLGFIVVRAVNIYGDPSHWVTQQSDLYTALSFINTTKYPPSLLFLLMTLGPAFVLLAIFENPTGEFAQPLIVFGRVPLFYYLLHLPLIHGLMLVFAMARYGNRVLDMDSLQPPPDWGYGLPVVYLIWMGVLLTLYPLCRWFAAVKRRSRKAWLSYL